MVNRKSNRDVFKVRPGSKGEKTLQAPYDAEGEWKRTVTNEGKRIVFDKV